MTYRAVSGSVTSHCSLRSQIEFKDQIQLKLIIHQKKSQCVCATFCVYDVQTVSVSGTEALRDKTQQQHFSKQKNESEKITKQLAKLVNHKDKMLFLFCDM